MEISSVSSLSPIPEPYSPSRAIMATYSFKLTILRDTVLERYVRNMFLTRIRSTFRLESDVSQRYLLHETDNHIIFIHDTKSDGDGDMLADNRIILNDLVNILYQCLRRDTPQSMYPQVHVEITRETDGQADIEHCMFFHFTPRKSQAEIDLEKYLSSFGYGEDAARPELPPQDTLNALTENICYPHTSQPPIKCQGELVFDVCEIMRQGQHIMWPLIFYLLRRNHSSHAQLHINDLMNLEIHTEHHINADWYGAGKWKIRFTNRNITVEML